uniref:Vacuolar protein sorting-associated protein 51 homolog n=1 Tax=Strigamia maritima TaxID=126957 RepID=T1J0Z4_STRMM
MASANPNTESVPERRRAKSMLKNYYSLAAGDNEAANPLHINSPHFNPDMYISKLIKERSLTDLMDHEREIHKEIQSLDSDMQTLVYENYNKFISATDTIRKMKNDFKRMEDEMDGLATNMESITTFSGQISNTLRDRRQQITKLASVHTLLKKLQFLFELPARLNKCIEDGLYSQAVRYYLKAEKVLLQYQHMPSFHGIQMDCNDIVTQLKAKLRVQFRMKEATARQLTESLDLLLQLQEPAEDLCQEFLDHADQKLREDLSVLERQVRLQAQEETPLLPSQLERPAQAYMDSPVDVLEFIDFGCNNFLTNICLVIASYNDMFINRIQDDIDHESTSQFDTIALNKLVNFVMALMNNYFHIVERRIELEKETDDTTILVRALDRFHRRLQAMNSLLPDTDFARTGTDIVSKAGRSKCLSSLETLKRHFADCLTDIRQSLITGKPTSQREGSGPNLSDLLHSAEAVILEQLRTVLSNLQAFLQSDITFSTKHYFRDQFCNEHVRETVVLGFFRHVNEIALEFCDSLHERSSSPPPLLLILSRMCVDFESSTINTMVALTDEYFETDNHSGLTPASTVCAETKDVAQKLINHYVRVQGLIISQMLRKSVETRDWLNTIEPRTVRAVMKRVVEDVTAMDAQVGQLYEEGTRKERSSDSSRRIQSLSAGRHIRQTWSSYTPSTIDNSLISNIQKLFSERIEFFSSVQFSKVSILTGIIKISLKTFLECVRLRTFGRYGLQQIQVDTHYLQLYLWRFVSDETLVHVLLDEILGSTVHRCLDPDPVLMESSVIIKFKNFHLANLTVHNSCIIRLSMLFVNEGNSTNSDD